MCICFFRASCKSCFQHASPACFNTHLPALLGNLVQNLPVSPSSQPEGACSVWKTSPSVVLLLVTEACLAMQLPVLFGNLVQKLPLPPIPHGTEGLIETIWLLLTSVIAVPLICKLPGGSPVLGFLVGIHSCLLLRSQQYSLYVCKQTCSTRSHWMQYVLQP